MKRLFAVIVCTAMLSVSKPAAAQTFTDLEGNGHAEAIYTLAEQGIVTGYEDQTYRPDQAVTRNNVVKLLGRFMVKNDYTIPEDAEMYPRFEDVSLTNDKELARLAAVVQEEGIFVGSEGFLDSTNLMERQHMAVVLVRALKTIYNVDVISAYKEAQFTPTIHDLGQAGDIEKQEAIIALRYANITVVDYYEPRQHVTRAQFATFLARMMAYGEQHRNDVETIQPTYNEALAQISTAYIPERTKLYSSSNLKQYTALWRQPQQAMPFTLVANDTVAVVTIGKEKYYVDAALLQPAPVVVPYEAPTVGTVRTKPYYRIYDKPDGSLLMEGVTVTKLSVTAISGDYYVVEAGGKQGYIRMNDTTLSSRLPYKVAIETPYLNTALKRVGALSPGFIFDGNGTTGNYVKISSNGGTYHVAKQALVEGTTPLSLQNAAQPTYPAQIVAQHDAAVMTSGGAKIGAIAKGQSYTLLQVTNTTGLVEFAGGIGYINLQDFMHTNQIAPKKNISYEEMTHHLKVFSLMYPEFTELVTFGASVEGRPLYALRVGNGRKEVLMDASIHAREHMTTNVLLEMIDQYSYAYANGQSFNGYDVQKLLDSTSIWFVPMMNPDGVTLVQGGLASAKNAAAIQRINGGSTNVARWKANIRGVDLNRNFDGGWVQKETTVAPSFKNFKGYRVFSEPEALALQSFVKQRAFKSYISWHSSGQIIYWSHNQNATNAKRDRALAQRISNVTGYSLVPPNRGCCSGASTDWFIQYYALPAITMEIAPYAGESVVPLSRWDDVWKRNKTVGLIAATEANGR